MISQLSLILNIPTTALSTIVFESSHGRAACHNLGLWRQSMTLWRRFATHATSKQSTSTNKLSSWRTTICTQNFILWKMLNRSTLVGRVVFSREIVRKNAFDLLRPIIISISRTISTISTVSIHSTNWWWPFMFISRAYWFTFITLVVTWTLSSISQWTIGFIILRSCLTKVIHFYL